MSGADAQAILAEPNWLAHRYDRRRDEVSFVWLPREKRREIGFLTQPEATAATPRQTVPRAALAACRLEPAPLHLVLHSGLTGSTLLTRAFDREGVATTFSEPPILTDIVSYRLAGAAPDDAARLADLMLALLARPFEPGEAVIVKAGAVGNALGIETLQRHPASRALCLHAPLRVYLASSARKGLWGRVWGRRLFATLGSAGLTDIGFTPAELFEQTDLQIAALAWLALHRVMGQTVQRFPDRVRSTDSETLIARPAEAIGAIADHLGLEVDAAAIAADPLFQRHAKTGGEFNADLRKQELEEATAAHREEIDMVVQWAARVAEAQQIALELPRRLAI